MPSRLTILFAIALFLIAVPSGRAQAQRDASPISIEVVATFDYPDAFYSTAPYSINNRGDCAGTYLDSGRHSRGFVRFRNGAFSAPLADPDDTTGFTTIAQGINSVRRVCGYFFDGQAYAGFLFHWHTYTTYRISGALNTLLLGENDAGDLVGAFDDLNSVREGFLDHGGTIEPFVVGSASTTYAYAVNANDEIVGTYYDPSSVAHGFFRDGNGNLTFPIDFPGSGATFLRGINNNGLLVGTYFGRVGDGHAFLLKMPDQFISFDYPGALGTFFYGINDAGLICGDYFTGEGINHGFIARVR